MNKEIDELLLKADLGINNALRHPEVAGLMSLLGYTPEKLTAGKVILTNAQNLQAKQVKEAGEEDGASDELRLKRSEAHHTYMNYVKIARIAFKNDAGMWTKLQLNGRRKQSYSGWISQARLFYTNLMADEPAMAKISEFGVTAEKLQAGMDLVLAVEDQLARLKQESGEAQDATKARDKAVDVLQDWYSDFRAIARIALQGRPQFLEMLGIIEPS
ncbi:hypothetical protein [uncultured Sunxiuqinia sp.]|uniref:hypothetical protein n=1 Tax=uncultured Sunxiuqinia sp. TaxID=1573825 RepID=UPI00262D811E|nr:hypothetical protein [uncultured Sunxiuqinia sp.]